MQATMPMKLSLACLLALASAVPHAGTIDQKLSALEAKIDDVHMQQEEWADSMVALADVDAEGFREPLPKEGIERLKKEGIVTALKAKSDKCEKDKKGKCHVVDNTGMCCCQVWGRTTVAKFIKKLLEHEDAESKAVADKMSAEEGVFFSKVKAAGGFKKLLKTAEGNAALKAVKSAFDTMLTGTQSDRSPAEDPHSFMGWITRNLNPEKVLSEKTCGMLLKAIDANAKFKTHDESLKELQCELPYAQKRHNYELGGTDKVRLYDHIKACMKVVKNKATCSQGGCTNGIFISKGKVGKTCADLYDDPNTTPPLVLEDSYGNSPVTQCCKYLDCGGPVPSPGPEASLAPGGKSMKTEDCAAAAEAGGCTMAVIKAMCPSQCT